jgi:hypothetical protein
MRVEAVASGSNCSASRMLAAAGQRVYMRLVRYTAMDTPDLADRASIEASDELTPGSCSNQTELGYALCAAERAQQLWQDPVDQRTAAPPLAPDHLEVLGCRKPTRAAS